MKKETGCYSIVRWFQTEWKHLLRKAALGISCFIVFLISVWDTRQRLSEKVSFQRKDKPSFEKTLLESYETYLAFTWRWKLKSFLAMGWIHFSQCWKKSPRPADSISVYTRTAFFIYLETINRRKENVTYIGKYGWIHREQESFLKKHITAILDLSHSGRDQYFKENIISNNLNERFKGTWKSLCIEWWWIWFNLVAFAKSS